MPVSWATCDIVTDRSPCLATSAAVASRVASRTAALAKLLTNLVATTILLPYTQTLGALADVARDATKPSGDPSPVLHAGAGLLLLLGATALAVYKPQGLTPYGQRKQCKQRPSVPAVDAVRAAREPPSPRTARRKLLSLLERE